MTLVHTHLRSNPVEVFSCRSLWPVFSDGPKENGNGYITYLSYKYIAPQKQPLGPCFGDVRRLYNCQTIPQMQDIHSTKNQVRLTVFKVTADFHLLHWNTLCWVYITCNSLCELDLGIPNVLTTNRKPKKNPMVMLRFDLGQKVKVKSNIVGLESP